MRKISLLNKKGVSFIEVMVAGTIFTFMMGALVTVFNTSNTSWKRQDAAVSTQREVRRALIYLAKDLRSASSALTLAQSASSVTLSFTTPTAGAVTYTWTTSGGTANRIIRQTGITSTTVGNYITAFTITDNTSDIDINVTATSSNAQGALGTYQLTKTVAKR